MDSETRSDAAGGCPHCGPSHGETSPAAPVASKPAIAAGAYVCPMHPQVEQGTPGSCPICGMALEPRVVTLDEAPTPELDDMTLRLKGAIVPAAIVFLLAMSSSWRQHLFAGAVSE